MDEVFALVHLGNLSLSDLDGMTVAERDGFLVRLQRFTRHEAKERETLAGALSQVLTVPGRRRRS